MGQHQAFCFAFLSCGGHSAQPAHPKTTRWAGWQMPISKGRKVRPGWEMVPLRARVRFPQRGEPLPSLSNHLQLKGGRKTPKAHLRQRGAVFIYCSLTLHLEGGKGRGRRRTAGRSTLPAQSPVVGPVASVTQFLCSRTHRRALHRPSQQVT